MVADVSGPGSLRARVYAVLDSQVQIGEYFDAGNGDDPYLLWMTARGLGVGVDAVAEYVHEWCQRTPHPHHPSQLTQDGSRCTAKADRHGVATAIVLDQTRR
jgi:hypothetical protein